MMRRMMVFLLLACCGTLFAEDVLKNGDFEQKFQGWDYPYWEKKPMPGTVVTDVVYGGKNAFLFFREGDKGNYIYTPVKLEPGKTCRIKLAVKSEGAPENDLFVRLLLYKKDPKTGKDVPAGFAWGGTPDNKLIQTGGTHDWKEFVFQVNSANFKPEITGAALFIYRSNNGTGKIYLDEVSVVPVETKPPAPKEQATGKGGATALFSPAKNLWPADSSFETGSIGFALPRDSAQAFHGGTSLRMDSGLSEAGSSEFFQLMKPGKAYTFSFAIRAARSTRMEFYAVNDSYTHAAQKTFEAGPEWKRIDVPLQGGGRTTGLSFNFRKPKDAVVWLDALQFNEGGAALYVPEAPLAVGMDPVEPNGQTLFCSPEKLVRTVSVRNNDGVPRKVRVTAELEPAFGEKRELFLAEPELQSGEVFRREVVLLPEQKRGYYVVRLAAESGKERVKADLPFLIADPPLPVSDDSFFGLHYNAYGRNIGMSWARAFRFWQFWSRYGKGDYIVTPQPVGNDGIRRMDTINIGHPPVGLKQGAYASDAEIDRFVLALASGLGGKYIEIENEPDLTFPNLYGKGLEYGAEKYAEQVNRLAPEIRKAAPGVKIMASGVSGVDFNSNFPFTEKVLTEAGKNIDILAVHPYSGARYIGPDRSDIGPEANRVYAKTIDLENRIAKHGGTQEVWYGEIGWALDVDEDFLSDSAFRHAAYLARLMLLGKAANVKKVMYFMGDSCIERERYYYGIWRAGQPLPAAGVYAATAQILEGAKPLELLANSDFHCFMFRHRDGREFAAVWLSTDSPANLTIDLPARQVEVRDMFNNPVAVSGDGPLTLTISGNPLYLFPQGVSGAEWKAKLTAARCDLPPLKAAWRLKNADTLILRLENIRTRPQDGTLKLDGAAFRNPERSFSLPPGESSEFEFRSSSSLNRKEIRLDAVGTAGSYTAAYRAEITGCPEFTPDLNSTDTGLPKAGRLPVMDSRTHLLPNDPGNGWSGPENLSAESAVCHDAENLYLLVNVRDDIHFQNGKPGMLWAGDSIQLAIDSKANALPGVHNFDRDDYEFGFGLTPSGAQKELTGIYEIGRVKSALDSVKCNIFREGDLTCYRIAIPWKTMKLVPEKGMILGLNFTANDNDGHGIRFWMGPTPGIVETKNPYAYQKFALE